MATAQCPIEGCNYEDALKSVEAHISGSPSGGHKGRSGREFRGELVDQVESKLNGEDGDLFLSLSATEWAMVLIVVASVVYLATRGNSEEDEEDQEAILDGA